MTDCEDNFGRNLCHLGVDCQSPDCCNAGKLQPDEVTVLVGRDDVPTEIITRRAVRH